MIKTKAQLQTAISSLPNPITASSLTVLLSDMVDSWEDIIKEYTIVQRDALTPVYGQKIMNTDTGRVEQFTDDWFPIGDITGNSYDGSANSNYPPALMGDTFVCIGAGKIGGASGKVVAINDIITCIGNNAGGSEASVGSNWKVTKSA